jgi:hypothetical protein
MALHHVAKTSVALEWIRSNPESWFRDLSIDERDHALLNANPVSFMRYDQSSFVRKIYHLKEGSYDFDEVGTPFIFASSAIPSARLS